MPHGLSNEEFDELTDRYVDIFDDLIQFGPGSAVSVEDAQTAIADAADAVIDGEGDPYEVLTNLLNDKQEAAKAYREGMDIDFDLADYEDYELEDKWFFYH